MSTTFQKISDGLIQKAKECGIPVIGQFELTARCNLRCKMCYVSKPAKDSYALSKERSAKEWISLAEQARDAGMLYLLLTGGEVFLRWDFKEIYEAVAKMGFNIELNTNATLITPETAKWLRKMPPSVINVTVYGASPETYEKICGSAYGYQSAINGINLLSAENLNMKLRTTVIKDNVKDFERLAVFAERKGTTMDIVDYISPRRDGCNTHPKEERLSPKELVMFDKYVDEYYRGKEILKKDTVQKEEAFECGAGQTDFWVTWDGGMTPCGLMTEPRTFPFQENFQASWNKLKDMWASIPLCIECNKCSTNGYCLSCPARLKNETGAYDRPAPYLCKLAEERRQLIEA